MKLIQGGSHNFLKPKIIIVTYHSNWSCWKEDKQHDDMKASNDCAVGGAILGYEC